MLLLSFVYSCTSDIERENILVNIKEAPANLISRLSTNNKSLNYKLDTGPCDGATSYGIAIETNFDLKRPINACQSGFWFCSETTTYLQCLNSSGDVLYQVEIFTGNREVSDNKYTFDLIELDNHEIVLSFPKSYFINGNYESSDLEFFSVDEKFEILPKTHLIVGDYTVYSHEDRLIVLLPITNES